MQQTIGISLTLGLVAGIMHYLPWVSFPFFPLASLSSPSSLLSSLHPPFHPRCILFFLLLHLTLISLSSRSFSTSLLPLQGGRYGPLPYDPDMIVQRDNDRIIAGMALREWEDIKPPPGKVRKSSNFPYSPPKALSASWEREGQGRRTLESNLETDSPLSPFPSSARFLSQGYGIFPGWDRSYTLDARIAGKPSTPEQWAEPQGRDVIWPAGGNRVLRPVAPKPELIDYSNM